MSLDPMLRSRIETLLQANRIVLFMKGDPRAPQ
ncbi:MAG TPA: monothiol glutaredoxin, Grx4 family, partial [Lysobacter sp.]|nr:monothiol glutaredoxin, Grx4 family [Lysobacter sp.]